MQDREFEKAQTGTWDVSSKDIEKQKQKEHFMLRIKTGVSDTVGLADSESGSGSRQIIKTVPETYKKRNALIFLRALGRAGDFLQRLRLPY
jgi:hypothetical protein